MNHSLVRYPTSEDELDRKRAELERLETKLVQRELDLTTLRADLYLFNREYLRVVGAAYAELDDVEAQIAEEIARLHPADAKKQQRAEDARARARESRESSAATDEGQIYSPSPSDRLKSLYRQLAKLIHPDLATDEQERTRRHALMTEANQAYSVGDEERLQALLNDEAQGIGTVPGDGIGAELIRVIRKIAQVQDRLRRIENEIAELGTSDVSQLRQKFNDAKDEGRDLFVEMVEHIRLQTKDARNALCQLRSRV